jgi:hypothetical protein
MSSKKGKGKFHPLLVPFCVCVNPLVVPSCNPDYHKALFFCDLEPISFIQEYVDYNLVRYLPHLQHPHQLTSLQKKMGHFDA